MRKLCFLSTIAIFLLVQAPEKGDTISHHIVKRWAHKLGFELSQLGTFVTNVAKFNESYKTAEVKPLDGNALVRDITKDIKTMMDLKMSAVRRISDQAEQAAEQSPEPTEPPPGEKVEEKEKVNTYKYVNIKNNTIALNHSVHFDGYVNTSMSAVHVPMNVYDRATRVIHAIEWSEKLDDTFKYNFEQDPSLSWQYFGSSTGFLRQYPARRWHAAPVDLYDCRTRSWYIEAATSPKDVLILMDVSGSMTGQRKEIARHVVNNILDTLGNNDFVNIITFSNITKEVVECFNDTLVQANLANVRELKNAIANLETERIANYSLALNRAFELLRTYREVKEGARCNQAIMLITDGVPYNYKEIFQKHNWNMTAEKPELADMPVRVFTYLIGKEVADFREVQWMACVNRGYFVHLCSLPEVREEVLKYVPVMARPLVLNGSVHPTIWTPVYADVKDPKMTDWLWEQRERKEQKSRLDLYLKHRDAYYSKEERDRRFVLKRRRIHDSHQDLYQGYKLMTTVSTPVYDRRKNATKIADLLGVAGTDVPISEIEKLMRPHMLGVNGYAFIVTNNGYILVHPDLRPVFDGILKPAYNSVDMSEVELMDHDRGPRDFDEGIIALREDIISQADGTATLHTKYHYDDMNRVGRVRRKYHYTGIHDTPFTVVVSLPEYDHSGIYHVQATEEVHRAHIEGKNVTDYFAGKNWRVHPDWTYCRYHFENVHNFSTPEALLVHFLERIRQPGWKWYDRKQLSQPPEYRAANVSQAGVHPTPKPDKESYYYCDRTLLLSLVFDAKVTEWFANPSTTRDEKGPLARLMNLLPREEFQKRYGFILAFMATHNGLTRYHDFSEEEGKELPKHHFINRHTRAIDEVWYKRAVEQYYFQPDSFVFSVPFEESNKTLVTASRAIFIQAGSAKAPAAVVGFQIEHEALQHLFQNITHKCDGDGVCSKHCGNDNFACYLIDNHGYILVSKENVTGRFFGEVRGAVMADLVNTGIFDRVQIFDYQAVCFKTTTTSNDANILLTPWRNLQKSASWLMGQVAWAWAKSGIWNADYAEAFADPSEEEAIVQDEESHNRPPGAKDEKAIEREVFINRTRPETCDQKINLYLLQNVSSKMYDIDMDDDDAEDNCERPYVVQPVDSSNMLLVVVNENCKETNSPPMYISPEEIFYENNTLACQKALNSLKRQRPESCIRYHEGEGEIKDMCGGAVTFLPNPFYLLVSFGFMIACTRWQS